ncbi:hypothetical protein E4P29_04595 [Rhodococcus sp. 1R11]|uniref:hypothetical protein n=1 Tax=Rhodococcus sp. 1R11 TaxID=2559614 RepID=UPI0010729EF0|nr:hypothetical protein [Rhodococcus sp. 1R11]TFI45021.1 hypothetical protein E4P29_04595 [Rhodococcus sp. 1R11]
MKDWLVFIAAIVVPVIGIGGTYLKARIDSTDLRAQLTSDLKLHEKLPDAWPAKVTLQASIEKRIGELANPPKGWGLGASYAVAILGTVIAVGGGLALTTQISGGNAQLTGTPQIVVICLSILAYLGGAAMASSAFLQLRRRRRYLTQDA